ncbi:MAG: SMP-30/gluconolactonase/LRE family protein [Gammaproteobacteria bacterium]|nr:SMP-30/gluconolactonase/LRE family protein [Gammaproteobacteria bacterium]
MRKLLFLLGATVLFSACTAGAPPIEGCEPLGDIKPVCNMQTPEDIAALADGRHLLLAHFGGMTGGTGSLSLFDTHTEKLTPLFPPESGTLEKLDADTVWGEAGCVTPPDAGFSPHGTHLHRLADGRWRYLVVNHGGREAVEIFELKLAGENSTLVWRGCVLAAEETFMNDVVGLTNGDLIFSRMFRTGSSTELLLSLLGISSGDLWRWNRDSGLRVLPGTEAAQPNGLEISVDNRFVFANMYMEKEVWKIDADTGEKLAVGKAAYADNSAWGSDGRLWIATHSGGLVEIAACLESQAKPCSAAFEIIAMDPETMATEVVFAHRGPPMGVATVAVPQGDRVYMGSFVGDRMISVPNFAAGD